MIKHPQATPHDPVNTSGLNFGPQPIDWLRMIFPLDVVDGGRIMRDNLPGEPMNNRQVCCVQKQSQNAVPEGSPLPLFFRCIADLMKAPY
ncbi:hypothetical protein ACMV8I_13235 [Ewingella sp. S1.OA.A_B6]